MKQINEADLDALEVTPWFKRTTFIGTFHQRYLIRHLLSIMDSLLFDKIVLPN